MGKLNHFRIFLNNPRGVYFSGQVIEGHVSVDFKAPLNITGIRLRFRGRAVVKWSEKETSHVDRNQSHTTHRHFNSENKFDKVIVLYARVPWVNSNNLSHPSGQYRYPFRFQLPDSLPSSFEATAGHVRYNISGTIISPWQFDQTTTVSFTVISPLDLNREPTALIARQGHSAVKTVTRDCLFRVRKSGSVEAICCLERTGYVPGETIFIKGEITNRSNCKISCSYAELVQCIYFYASRKTRVDKNVIARVNHPEIPPWGTEVWDGDRLRIPPLPPSRLDSCGIIDIQYILKFCVDASGPASDLEISFDILIGSIPHHQVQQNRGSFIPPEGGAAVPSAPPLSRLENPSSRHMLPSSRIIPSAPVLTSNTPPPSYTECIDIMRW